MNIRLPYKERAKFCKNKLAQSLLELIDTKKTNLALSADVTNSVELLKLVETCGPEICLLKTHIDIINDFTPEVTIKLQKLAAKYNFLIFEDRKFADIGATVRHQYKGGIYNIANWADIINAHSMPGPGLIEELAEIGVSKNRGLLLIAEMSTKDNLIDFDYTNQTLHLAERFSDFVIGFIARGKINHQHHWLYLTPGISFRNSNDIKEQLYITPEEAINKGTDIIIVGRSIINANDPLIAARKYREAGWLAYQQAMDVNS